MPDPAPNAARDAMINDPVEIMVLEGELRNISKWRNKPTEGTKKRHATILWHM